MSFSDAMGWRAPDERHVVDPHASPELNRALEQFRSAADADRTRAETGSPMPRAHAALWEPMLESVDAFLALPPTQASVLDTVRARLQLETEVEADMHTYGDVPGTLAEREQQALKGLAARLALLTQKVKKVDPRRFAWPVQPVVVTSPYGHRVHPIFGDYRFHAGLDLGAEAAQPIRAAEAGRVVFSGWLGGNGKMVEVQHDSHTSTRYGHLMSLMVDAGSQVKKGDIIGLAGKTGQATGVHLHFELRRDGDALDPEFFLPNPVPLSHMVWR
jgi:murein DD-endopeptidase MepM/ murein hydrolase activator NlpD